MLLLLSSLVCVVAVAVDVVGVRVVVCVVAVVAAVLVAGVGVGVHGVRRVCVPPHQQLLFGTRVPLARGQWQT